MTRFLKIPYYILIGLIVLIGVLLAATLLPIPGNYQVKLVQSGSMEPSIKIGSVVVIKPMDNYKKGEIITFEGDKKEPVTHRILEVQVVEGKFYFTTKGDVNNAPDAGLVSKDKVLGKVVLDIPYLGYLIDFVQKPIGFILVLIIPALVIVSDELRKIWQEVRKIKNKGKS